MMSCYSLNASVTQITVCLTCISMDSGNSFYIYGASSTIPNKRFVSRKSKPCPPGFIITYYIVDQTFPPFLLDNF